MNSVNLIGRLTGEPRMTQTKTGKKVGHFCIAINGANSAVFIQITAWNPVCDTVEKYCHKGNMIGISGRLTTSSNGNLEVTANSIHLMDTRQTPNDSTNETSDDDFPM